jgi:hypothetical protein
MKLVHIRYLVLHGEVVEKLWFSAGQLLFIGYEPPEQAQKTE